MLKYYDVAVVFQEVPDEISLAIDLTMCPHRCPQCHSPWLREDVGEQLTPDVLSDLSRKFPGITCICFMGGDGDHESVSALAVFVRSQLKLKVAMYSGDDTFDKELASSLDYYKIGGYRQDLSGLDSPTTNQRMFKITEGSQIVDITNRFLKRRYDYETAKK